MTDADDPIAADLGRARSALLEAELSTEAADRFVRAHLASMRVAAVVLVVRGAGRRAAGGPGGKPARALEHRGHGGPQNAWTLLAVTAPELAEWAGFFAAVQAKREAVEQGARYAVTAREADDLVRDAAAFFALVESMVQRSSGLHRLPSAAEVAGA